MGRSRAAGWYLDPSDERTQRYFDGTQWTDHHAPVAPQATPVGGWPLRLAGIAVMVAATLVLFSLFADIVHDMVTGAPARVKVTDCTTIPSAKGRGNDQCWGLVVIDGKVSDRRIEVDNIDHHGIGRTYDARIDEHGVATTDNLFAPLIFLFFGSVALVLSVMLIRWALKLRSADRRHKTSG